ncbi:MAG: hypothetical protein AB7O52_09530 [Planctomycetota bacterium]
MAKATPGRKGASSRGKSPAAKKSSPAKAASNPRPSKPARAPAGRGGYEINCSECYTSFSFQPSGGGSAITCPVCMHVGQFAENDVMTKVVMAKRAEKSSFLMAVVPTVLLFVAGLAYAGSLALKGTAGMESTQHYIFGGVGALLLIATIALGVKYENNRYDVYF